MGGRELDDEEHAAGIMTASSIKERALLEDDGSRWLETLLRKFHNECSHVMHIEHDTSVLRSLFREEMLSSTNDSPVSGEKPVLSSSSSTFGVPLGKLGRPRLDHFASFLSCCAVGVVPMRSGIEVQALAKVSFRLPQYDNHNFVI